VASPAVSARDLTAVAVPSTYQQEQDYRGSLGTTANFSLFVGFRLRGPFHAQHAERAVNMIAARHEVLRTSLHEVDNRVVQHVAAGVTVPFDYVSLAGQGRRRSRHLQKLVGTALDEPFDLARPPWMRATVIRVGPLDHILALTVPHTVWDSACRPVFVREFASLYETAALGLAPPRPPAIQMGDLAHWQRIRENPRARSYWENQLAGGQPRLALPLDRQRARQRGYRLRDMLLPALSRGVGARLKAISNTAGGMLAAPLSAATAVVLGAQAGQDEVTLSLMHASRDPSETHDLLGFVADVIPLRISLRADQRFRDLVREVVDTTQAAFLNMLPSGRLWDLLESPPEVMVNPQQLRPPVAVTTQTGLRIADYRPDPPWKMFPTHAVWYRAPIDVDFRIGPDHRIAPSLSYNAEAFDDTDACRLGTDLRRTLERAALAPDRTIGQLI
jgi:hypothetical protein